MRRERKSADEYSYRSRLFRPQVQDVEQASKSCSPIHSKSSSAASSAGSTEGYCGKTFQPGFCLTLSAGRNLIRQGELRNLAARTALRDDRGIVAIVNRLRSISVSAPLRLLRRGQKWSRSQFGAMRRYRHAYAHNVSSNGRATSSPSVCRMIAWRVRPRCRYCMSLNARALTLSGRSVQRKSAPTRSTHDPSLYCSALLPFQN